MNLKLQIMPGTFAVCKLDPQAALPRWALSEGALTSITRTADELSIVCGESAVPDDVRCEKGWRCVKILGPLPFSMTGVLASLVGPLAEAKISVFALSTYDTDYVLIKAERLQDAIRVLRLSGHEIGREE